MVFVITVKSSSAGAFAINFIVYLLMRTIFKHIFSHIIFFLGTSLKKTFHLHLSSLSLCRFSDVIAQRKQNILSFL